MIVRVPHATNASTRTIGNPVVVPWLLPPLLNTARFAGVSGQHRTVPSIATTSRSRQNTPVRPEKRAVPVSGPRNRSNNARNGATPTRARAVVIALAAGIGIGGPGSPAHSRVHTWPRPISVNNPAASSKYTTTREGSSRDRRCTAPVSASAASTISNGTIRVSSPRCPGANRPPAKATTRLLTESVLSGAPGGWDVLEDDLSYRSSAPYPAPTRRVPTVLATPP